MNSAAQVAARPQIPRQKPPALRSQGSELPSATLRLEINNIRGGKCVRRNYDSPFLQPCRPFVG